MGILFRPSNHRDKFFVFRLLYVPFVYFCGCHIFCCWATLAILFLNRSFFCCCSWCCLKFNAAIAVLFGEQNRKYKKTEYSKQSQIRSENILEYPSSCWQHSFVARSMIQQSLETNKNRNVKVIKIRRKKRIRHTASSELHYQNENVAILALVALYL